MNQAAVVISNFTPMSNPILFQKIPLTQERGYTRNFEKLNRASSFFYDLLISGKKATVE